MLRHITFIALGFGVAASASCERAGKTAHRGAKTPEEASRNMYNYFLANDRDGMWSLVTEEVREQCRRRAALIRRRELSGGVGDHVGAGEDLARVLKPPTIAEMTPRRICVFSWVPRTKDLPVPKVSRVEMVGKNAAKVWVGGEGGSPYYHCFRKIGSVWRLDSFPMLDRFEWMPGDVELPPTRCDTPNPPPLYPR